MTLICWGFVLASGGNAYANSLKEIRITFESGSYDMVVEQASALGSSDGMVLAAEALNAKLILGQGRHKAKTAKQAMKLAETALKLDPENKEALIQYATAYGLYGKYVSSFTAWRKKLAPKIRASIDTAAAANPNDPRVEALKGAWHLNLLYRAKGFDVGKHYGASEAQGMAHFQNALRQDPDDSIVIYANSLMLSYILSPKEREAQTRILLQTVLLQKTPRNAFEQQIMAQMQAVYAGFDSGTSLQLAETFINQ